jgi:hypothetical protein
MSKTWCDAVLREAGDAQTADSQKRKYCDIQDRAGKAQIGILADFTGLKVGHACCAAR